MDNTFDWTVTQHIWNSKKNNFDQKQVTGTLTLPLGFYETGTSTNFIETNAFTTALAKQLNADVLPQVKAYGILQFYSSFRIDLVSQNLLLQVGIQASPSFVPDNTVPTELLSTFQMVPLEAAVYKFANG